MRGGRACFCACVYDAGIGAGEPRAGIGVRGECGALIRGAQGGESASRGGPLQSECGGRTAALELFGMKPSSRAFDTRADVLGKNYFFK